MSNETDWYENQEMESTESPVPQEDEEHSVEGIQKEQAPAMEEPAAPAIPPQASAHRRQATQTAARRSSVVAIGAQLQAETEAEKNRNDLLDLVESMKSRRVLSGTIQGVERPENSPSHSMAVLYHGDFKVIIPAEEMVDPPEDLHGLPKSEVLFSMVNRRMGAEVDYVVKGVDQESGLAAARRLEAMAIKRREYYTGAGRDGNNLLYEGVCAEARVVSVLRGGIFVELFGVETYIPLRELNYQRMLAATGRQSDRPHSGHQSRNKPYLGRDHPCLYAPLRRTFVQFFVKSLWNRFPGTGFAQSNKFLYLPCFFAGNVVV